jgi:hypothetical protein
MDKEQFIKHFKAGHTLEAKQDVWVAGMHEMLMEWLGAAEQVLAEALDVCEGDVALLNDGERRLYELYASWDEFYQADHKTTKQLVEAAGGTYEPVVKHEDPEPEEDEDGSDE